MSATADRKIIVTLILDEPEAECLMALVGGVGRPVHSRSGPACKAIYDALNNCELRPPQFGDVYEVRESGLHAKRLP